MDLPAIPAPPEAPEPRPYSYDRWAPQEELRGLSRWLHELEDFVREPESRHLRGIYQNQDSYHYEGEGMRAVAMPQMTWETLERKARAFDALRPAVGRLLHFMEGQERAMRDSAAYIKSHTAWRS